MDYTQLLHTFHSKYGTSPRIFRSPGRINIIGEHTDYNDGFVLPAAVDKEIAMAICVNDSDKFRLYSCDAGQEVTFTGENYQLVKEDWAQYIIGVIDELKKAGYTVSGIDCAFTGDIPMGAGMSSSAALECAALFGLNELFGFNLGRHSIVKLAQRAENEYVGVKCGIMDQFASVFAEQNHALKLDCRDLNYESYSLDLGEYHLVLVDSMVKHSLASSEYNVRRAECEKGVSVFKKHQPEVGSLRDVSIHLLHQVKDELEGKVFQRCKYIIEEIMRVNKACESMQNNNLSKLGELLYATHHGLQHEYEVSCAELDFLVDFTRNREEILGARMMGGGFGGCTINLVKESTLEKFVADVQVAYQREFGKTPEVYPVNTASGSSEIENEIITKQ